MKVGRFFGRFLASVQIERVFVNPQEPCQSTCVHHRSKSHVHPAYWSQIPYKFALFFKWWFSFLTEILVRIVQGFYTLLQRNMNIADGILGTYVWSFTARIPLIETRICIRILEESLKHSKRIQFEHFVFASGFNCLSGKSDSP